jgi:hypothetical protein
MGLDISAYKNIKKSDAQLDEEGYAIDPTTGEELAGGNWFSSWINPDFPGRADDIEDSSVYTFEDSTGLSVGYGGHFWWRDELAKLVGYPEAELDMGYRKEKNHFSGACQAGSGAFYELINFSDSEGVIGTEVSKKLAADFAEFEGKSKEMDERFTSLYQQWKSAFDMASENGCVIFH